MRQRCQIIWRLSQGMSQRNIAAEIPCGQSTVSRIGQKWIRERVIEPQKPPGQPKETTEEQDNVIIEAGVLLKFDSVESMMKKIREELHMDIELSRYQFNKRLLGINYSLKQRF